MPMPTGGTWPPPNIAPAYQAYRDWDAWYVGNPDQLTSVYQGRDTAGPRSVPPSQRTRASQYAGGVIGTLSRWLWGAPQPTTSKDSRLHVPLPADLAGTAAALLFSEPPKLKAEGDEVQARLEELVEAGLFTVLRHGAEAASVLGDIYLRPVIDREVSPDAAMATIVHADGAVPVLRWGHLVEVTFWTQLAGDNPHQCLRLIEHHEPGRIQYGLFEGTATTLGRPVAFSEHPDAAYLADIVDETGSQATGLDRLDVVRVPNAGPQRRWRKLGGLKYLGRSDYDGNEPIFDRIDEVWTSWMRDIHLGRGRLTVPGYMLQDLGPGQGATWDADREVYSAVNAAPSAQAASSLGITVSQFEIRHEAHKATLDALVETAMRHAGLSSQTLGEEGDVAMTATEAVARERLSYITRGDRIATWTPAIVDYVELHLAVERINGLGTVEPVKPTVEFGDAVSESPETIAKTVQLLRAAEVLSIETGVRMVHPDWEDPQVEKEVDRITKERSAGMPGTEDPLATGRNFANADLPADEGSDDDGPPER